MTSVTVSIDRLKRYEKMVRQSSIDNLNEFFKAFPSPGAAITPAEAALIQGAIEKYLHTNPTCILTWLIENKDAQ